VYDVYQATTPGGEDFSRPTYTPPPGATSFVTPEVPDDSAYYFVVRARDVAGDPETGGSCTSSFTTCFDTTGGLDQNIYAATITP